MSDFPAALTNEEMDILRRALGAMFRYFDFDFHTRLGVTENEMREILAGWPAIGNASHGSPAFLAINNSMNELLNGLGVSDREAVDLTGVDRVRLQQIFHKWASARDRTPPDRC